MVPESEIKAEGHRKSGHHVLDLAIAGTALFISLCSLGLAIHSGRAMDRLVEANSRPELVFAYSDIDPRGSSEAPSALLRVIAENPGAGYARVEWMSLEVQGQDVKDWQDAVDRVHDPTAASGTLSLPSLGPHEIVTSNLSHTYLKPGASLTLFSWPRTENNAALWDKVHDLKSSFHLTACYCSIFEQCWVARSNGGWPSAVKNCAAVRPKNINPL